MTNQRARQLHERPAEFLVPIAQISKAPGSRRQVSFTGTLPDLEVSASRVPAGEPLQVDAMLESVSEGILVTGTVKTRFEGECRRCLGQAAGELVVSFQELCTEEPTDEETYPLSPDILDLAPLVHDACILALPLAPLCEEGCLGICSGCGANRNFEQCSCEVQRDPRWSALDLFGGAVTTGRELEAPSRDE